MNDKRDYYRETYLKSEHWAHLRDKAFLKYPRCVVCGGWEHLDVHHKRYKNLYDTTVLDVVVLYRKHHDLVHAGTARFTGSMKELILEHRLNAMLSVALELRKAKEEEAKYCEPPF